MTKEKIVSLEKYKAKLEDSLKGHVPEKHKHHPKTYHEFLHNEISNVAKKLDAAKLLGSK